jgi:uncharacterized protein (TIGR00251 family)
MRVKVKVITGAPKAEIFLIAPDQLKIKLVHRPEKGKANQELIELLADHYDVAKSRIRIVRGEKSKEKIVEIFSPSP